MFYEMFNVAMQMKTLCNWVAHVHLYPHTHNGDYVITKGKSLSHTRVHTGQPHHSG